MQIPEKRRQIEQLNGRYCPHHGLKKWLRWENLSFLEPVLDWGLRISGLSRRGMANVLNLRLVEQSLFFQKLPAAFDNFKILWISDLHCDQIKGLLDKVLDLISTVQWDISVIGGDFCFGHSMSIQAASQAKQLADFLVRKSPVYAVLGNHDFSPIAYALADAGVTVLLNRAISVKRQNAAIWLVGVDDCHFFKSDDLELAIKNIANNGFRILLSHSPEIYRQAADKGFDLLLSGHTHGGQICLWNGAAVVSSIDAPRKCIRGVWQEGQMIGFTSTGAGASGVAARFNCPSEVNIITLKKTRIDDHQTPQ